MAEVTTTSRTSMPEDENMTMGMPEPMVISYEPTLYDMPEPVLYNMTEGEQAWVDPAEWEEGMMYAFDETMMDGMVDEMMNDMVGDMFNSTDYDMMYNTTGYDMMYDTTMEPMPIMEEFYDYDYSEMLPEKENYMDTVDDVYSWTQEQMRADFRDMYGYAMDSMDFDYSMPSRCNDKCY